MPNSALKEGMTKRFEAIFYDDASRELAALAAVPCRQTKLCTADVTVSDRALFRFFNAGTPGVNTYASQ